ncbi:MAG TPA: hypothetical protein VKX40_08180 [Aequorivita sp.]|nr:hypothetical protein [Aequorivita sp.]
MKNLIALFAFLLIATNAQSQSLTEKELTGTWQVVSVENPSSNSKAAKELDMAFFNFHSDRSFVLRTRKDNSMKFEYETVSSKNAEWSFDSGTQTIRIPRAKMTIKVSGTGDKAVFTIQETGLRLQMVKPI